MPRSGVDPFATGEQAHTDGVPECGDCSEGQQVVAVVAVLCVATLVLLVGWGLRVMHEIAELENLPRARHGFQGDTEPPAQQAVRLIPEKAFKRKAS